MAKQIYVDLSDTINSWRLKTNSIAAQLGDLDNLRTELTPYDSDLVQVLNYLYVYDGNGISKVDTGATAGTFSVAGGHGLTQEAGGLKLEDMEANTVKVRGANSTGASSNLLIDASRVLGRGASGDLISTQIETAMIAASAVTNAKLSNMADNTVKVNATSSSATPTNLEISSSNVLGRGASGSLVSTQIETAMYADSSIVRTKLTDGIINNDHLDVSNGGTNSTAGYFLKDDGDKTFSWAIPGNTTYTAGTDLDLTGTVFSLESTLNNVAEITRSSGNLKLSPAGEIELTPGSPSGYEKINCEGPLYVTGGFGGSGTHKGNFQAGNDANYAYEFRFSSHIQDNADRAPKITLYNTDTIPSPGQISGTLRFAAENDADEVTAYSWLTGGPSNNTSSTADGTENGNMSLEARHGGVAKTFIKYDGLYNTISFSADSCDFDGIIRGLTAAAGTNTTQLATTAFVQANGGGVDVTATPPSTPSEGDMWYDTTNYGRLYIWTDDTGGGSGGAWVDASPMGDLDIGVGSITTTKIAADAVTTAKIAADAITTTEIAADAVTTAKIAADAITTTEIADDVGLGGNPTTTTQAVGNNTTRIATTAFVLANLGSGGYSTATARGAASGSTAITLAAGSSIFMVKDNLSGSSGGSPPTGFSSFTQGGVTISNVSMWFYYNDTGSSEVVTIVGSGTVHANYVVVS